MRTAFKVGLFAIGVLALTGAARAYEQLRDDTKEDKEWDRHQKAAERADRHDARGDAYRAEGRDGKAISAYSKRDEATFEMAYGNEDADRKQPKESASSRAESRSAASSPKGYEPKKMDDEDRRRD